MFSSTPGLCVTPGTQVRLALCQLAVTPDKEANIVAARRAIDTAVSRGAELVVLPEIWNSPYSNAAFPTYAEDVEGGASPSTAMLSAAAAQHGIVLVGGSIPERDGTRIYNTCYVYGRRGQRLGRHRKLHLFDIDIPGAITFKESETLTGGDAVTVVDTDVGRLGIGICYDLRFPELAALYAARGAQLLVYPGAFNTTTGPAHWELLQRARAVDNELFVATASPARSPDQTSYQAWGHSSVVDPQGRVVATTGHDPDIVVAEIDLAAVEEQRRNIPTLRQKRGDLYAIIDRTR